MMDRKFKRKIKAPCRRERSSSQCQLGPSSSSNKSINICQWGWLNELGSVPRFMVAYQRRRWRLHFAWRYFRRRLNSPCLLIWWIITIFHLLCCRYQSLINISHFSFFPSSFSFSSNMAPFLFTPSTDAACCDVFPCDALSSTNVRNERWHGLLWFDRPCSWCWRLRERCASHIHRRNRTVNKWRPNRMDGRMMAIDYY